MKFTKEKIKFRIIRRLVNWRKWRGFHTENIFGGLPKSIRGSKIVKEVIKELEDDAWLLSAQKTGEKHYSLNPARTCEIMQYYEKHSK